LGVQLFTGFLLATHYCADVNLSFLRVDTIIREVKYGRLFRIFHANGARMFFFLMYLHIGRGIYYFSFFKTKVWFVGVVILFLVIAAAFLGYVLP
jgi:ubiquinol-cytochrome c reductase cytochrome b subunit